MSMEKEDLIKTEKKTVKKSIMATEINRSMLKEFLECIDLNKFDSRSNIKFKNGISMGYWFGLNLRKILESKNKVCLEIAKQYKQKKRLEASRKILYLRKYKYMFFIMDNRDKFSSNSGIIFPDGTFVSDWFLSNLDSILSSDDIIDVKIKDQYNNYLFFQDLKIEFLSGDYEKFDFSGCVRFSTGAIMNLWWERFMDEILLSTDYVSLKIKEQYESYLSMVSDEKGKEVFAKKR